MTKLNIVLGAVVAVVFALCGLCAFNTIAGHTSVESPRVLLICSAAGEEWQRTLVGARAAAREFGAELQAEAPVPNQTPEQQSELLQRIRPADFDGIAISMDDPASQLAVVNDIATRTKVVTLGKDVENSKRLCHLGFSQVNAGLKAAGMARLDLTREGQVAMLTTAAAGGQNEMVRDRLAGFQEGWAADADFASHYPVVAVPINAVGSLSERLANPKLALIVAFDIEAAESAIKVMASRPASERIPMVSLDSSDMILKAVEEGRVSSAILNDAYEDGYEAIRRLVLYSRGDDAALPTPGFGMVTRSGEIVRKSNVADIRGRLAMPAKDGSRAAQLHLSSAGVNASLLVP